MSQKSKKEDEDANTSKQSKNEVEDAKKSLVSKDGQLGTDQALHVDARKS